MQDRFKFRIWDKAISEMVYDISIKIFDSCPGVSSVCACTSCGQITYRDNRLKDIEIMQSTGLKDKDEKLIFEGDIVRYIKKIETSIFTVKTEILFQIEWKNLKWKVKPVKIVKGSTGDVCGFDLHDIFKKDTYEQHQTEISIKVIGNIYENPELLSEVE